MNAPSAISRAFANWATAVDTLYPLALDRTVSCIGGPMTTSATATARSLGVSAGPSTPAQGSSFRPDIQGLRALAVVAVILDHANVGGFSGGFVGVDVFFVISGFLITQLLLNQAERTGTISPVEFYSRRARRILPAATVVLVASVLGSVVLLGLCRRRR